VTAPSPQVLGAASYLFRSWSDGGAASHDVTVAGADRTITARFAPAP